MTSRIDHNNPLDAGPLPLTYHYEMISDVRRVSPFEQAIAQHARGKRVLESGTGTGILSLLAAKHGAQAVYCTELDPRVAAFARKNFTRNGFTNVKLIEKSTTQLELSDIDHAPIDLVIAENLSTWQVTEPEVQVMNHITTHLAHGETLRLPSIMNNMLQLVSTNFSFYDLVELRTHYFEFTGIPVARSLSDAVLFTRFDFQEICPEHISHTVKIRVQEESVCNAVRVTSPLVICDGIEFTASDSLVPPVVIPLPEDIHVRPGDELEIGITYDTATEWESLQVTAKRA